MQVFFILAYTNPTIQMKKLLLLFLLITSFCNGQSKKELFFDIDSTSITKTEFLKKTDHTINIGGKTENDNTIINKLFLRKKIAALSPEKYSLLKNYLRLPLSDTAEPNNKIIVINYYSGLDHANETEGKSHWNIYHRSYPKKLNKMGDIAQYWIYKYDKNLDHHHADEINWLYDKSALIEKIFFPYHFNSGSFAVILPNGQYYTYFGEYGSDQVFSAIEEMKKYHAN